MKIAMVAMACMVLLGQSVRGLAQRSGAAAPKAVAPPLKIGSGDLLSVTIFDSADLSGQFRVNANGDIAVPLIGRVHVAGDTADAAAVLLQKLYVKADILRPDAAYANVFIAEYASQGIVVNGAVKNPGVYPALGVRMLNSVMAAAGGELQTAASKVVIARKDDPEHPVTVTYDPWSLQPKIPQVQIFPGDTITVPQAGIVYVVGDVKKPGGFVLNGRNSLSVEQVMALCEGSDQAAAMNRAQLVRTLKDGRKVAITVAVNRILNGKAPDVPLQDGDILYIPRSTAKYVAEQALTYSVNMGSQIAVYRSIYH